MARAIQDRTEIGLVTGRHCNPREEARLILFVDMENSNELAKDLGVIPLHRLLRRIIYDIGNAVQGTKGEIQKYVDDEAIMTWSAADVADGRPIDLVALHRS